MKRWPISTRAIAALVLLLLLASCSFLSPPGQETAEPPPALTDDRAGVLRDGTVERIEREGAALRDLTGAELTVFTLDFLGGRPIEEVARALFEQRQPGDPAQNNGLLLLLCIKEEDYYLLPGEGLAQALPPDRLREILDDSLEPDFGQGAYDAGVNAVFHRLTQELERIYGVSVSEKLAPRAPGEAEKASRDRAFLRLLAPLFFLLLSVLLFFLYFRAGRRRRRRVV